MRSVRPVRCVRSACVITMAIYNIQSSHPQTDGGESDKSTPTTKRLPLKPLPTATTTTRTHSSRSRFLCSIIHISINQYPFRYLSISLIITSPKVGIPYVMGEVRICVAYRPSVICDISPPPPRHPLSSILHSYPAPSPPIPITTLAVSSPCPSAHPNGPKPRDAPETSKSSSLRLLGTRVLRARLGST
jgi:hypothetical protein